MPLELEELERVLRILGREDPLIAISKGLPEQFLWDLLREILLLMRSREPPSEDESPKKRGLGYLYTLARAVEILGRFPTPEEQGVLLESSRFPDLEGWKSLSSLLQTLGSSQSSKAARKRLRERRRRYR
jgi:hypothetical protein